MTYFVVRHAQTKANRLTRAVYGKAGAHLNDAGRQQAQELSAKLKDSGINKDMPVAVSELIRTYETASIAGFTRIVVNPLLNEVNTSNPTRTMELIAMYRLPKEALDAAKAIIAHPPKERIWVTHGLVIAALQELLGQSEKENFIPAYCEVRRITIDNDV